VDCLVHEVTSVTASLHAALGLAASLGGLGSSRSLSLDRSGRLLSGRGSLDGSSRLLGGSGSCNGSGSGSTSSGSLSLSGSLGGGRARARAGTRARASGGGTLGLLSELALGNLGGLQCHSRAWDGVAGRVVVDVELDALVVGLVQLSSEGTLRELRAGTGDLEVEALGVVLSTVLLATGVESNDLVTENVRTGLDVLGDLDEPAVVVGNELVRGISTGVTGLDKTSLVDLEELEGLLVDGLTTGRTTRGQHVNDRSLVALGPGVPLDVDLLTSLDLGVALGVLSIAVADDVARAEGIRGDETVVGSGGGPGDEGLGGLVVGSRASIVAVVDGASDVDGGNVTVGSNAHGTGNGGEKSLGGERRHLEKGCWVRKVVVVFVCKEWQYPTGGLSE
jgi:hypothetical protein